MVNEQMRGAEETVGKVGATRSIEHIPLRIVNSTPYCAVVGARRTRFGERPLSPPTAFAVGLTFPRPAVRAGCRRWDDRGD